MVLSEEDHILIKNLYYFKELAEFISPDLWPPNNPNLVDFKIWGCVQERVYQKPIRDVDQLKQRLVEV